MAKEGGRKEERDGVAGRMRVSEKRGKKGSGVSLPFSLQVSSAGAAAVALLCFPDERGAQIELLSLSLIPFSLFLIHLRTLRRHISLCLPRESVKRAAQMQRHGGKNKENQDSISHIQCRDTHTADG